MKRLAIAALIAAILLPVAAETGNHAAMPSAAYSTVAAAAATAMAPGAAASGASSAMPAATPATSLYQLATPLTDAAGQRFTLKDYAGRALLVTMFYGDCHAACPIVIETLKRTVAALGSDGKRLPVLLISLDPKRDNPKSLSHLSRSHGLDSAQYRLAVAADETGTRMLASALNIRYRALDNGEISHTTRIALLDAAGAVQADSAQLQADPDAALVKRIASLLKAQKDKADQEIARLR